MTSVNIGILVRLAAGVASAVAAAQGAAAQDVIAYRQACHAAAAAALDANYFIAADDERNTLRIYRRGQSDPIAVVDVWKFLGTKREHGSDLQGAAVIGDRVYWISSHARNNRGNVQPSRRRFFATDIRRGAGAPTVTPVGKPNVKLLVDLRGSPQTALYKLREAGKLPPQVEGGFSIEGLAASPDGKLLIGLRNPVPNDRALIIPLLNPAAVIDGKKAELGTPISPDLDRRGIRSIDLVGSTYFLIGGAPTSREELALYRWSGKPDEKPTRVQGVGSRDLRPETLFAVPETRNVQILSDDRDVPIDGRACKDQPEAKRSFRGVVVTP